MNDIETLNITSNVQKYFKEHESKFKKQILTL